MQLTAALAAVFAAVALAAPPTFASETYEPPTLANLTTTSTTDETAAASFVSKRAEKAGATWCEHTRHTTPCARFDLEQARCYNLARYWNDKISSMYPTSRTDRCAVYAEANCRGQSLTVSWPGINRLADKGMNDKISSIRCFKFAAS
ncbi:Beta/gamma crystallin [Macrophomina phaseolina MS6]|uniref:Beta/gamma crystallin n=1 Tax=Macrophomina phaseolina (strain MS6) TaxID=1126212 RepID=K2QRE8_MACPH|nr:Beta/gamma crystallin [Macrophomina phaseolina MS6]